MKTRAMTSRSMQLALVVLFALLAAGAAIAEEEIRSSHTSEGKGIKRGAIGDGVVSYDEHAALVTSGERRTRVRSTATGSGAPSKSESTVQTSANGDFWFYDASVDLFSDYDNDGYYYGIDLKFDADTLYSSADVYAVIYLSYEFGPWNEYVETETFAIFGTSGTDEYTVETELVSGYLTGDYDMLIELYDAWDDSFVASFGPDDTSELSYLPLEDIGRDSPSGSTVVVTREGGGSFGWLFLAGLAGIVGLRASRT